MSDVTPTRLAVLQHQRRQRAFAEALSRISEEVGEPRREPIEADISLRLQAGLHTKLREMRAGRRLKTMSFGDVEGAVSAAQPLLSALGHESLFEVHSGTVESGFFTGPVSAAFLRACLVHGYEGVEVTLASLASGLLLDVALDDPLMGNFYEIEFW